MSHLLGAVAIQYLLVVFCYVETVVVRPATLATLVANCLCVPDTFPSLYSASSVSSLLNPSLSSHSQTISFRIRLHLDFVVVVVVVVVVVDFVVGGW